MAKDKDRIYMPVGAGGLMRYHEEKEAKIRLKPNHIIIIVITIVIFELLLKIFL